MKTARTRGARPFALPGLILLTLLAYANSFHAGFVLDNKGLILNDPRLRELTAANLRLIFHHTYWWPTGEGGVYRPFTTLTYLFNYAILGNGDRPAGYHLFNFLIHTGNMFLVYLLARRFILRFWPCVLIAAMWAVHPIQTESVTNIVGRADMLAAMGLLGGFLMYLRSLEANGKRWIWLAGLAAFSALGIFSKENAVVLPVAIVCYELVFRRSRIPGRPQIEGLLASLIPIGLWFHARSAALAASLPKEVPFTDNPILGAGFWPGRWTAVKVLAEYLGLTIWPARLSSDYSWSQIPIARGSAGDWFGLAVVAAFIPGLILLYRRHRGAFFLTAIGIAWMAPVSNVLFPIGTIMAERFLYVPVMGAIACIVVGVFSIAERRGKAWAPAVLCVLLAAMIVRTFVRNFDWKDDLSMAAASVNSSPESYKTHDLLANVLFAADPSHSDIGRVIRESEKSLAILAPLPDRQSVPDPYELAGTCYLYRRDYAKAIDAFHRFLSVERAEFSEFRNKLQPDGPSAESADRITAARSADVYTLLSMAYLRSGNLQEATVSAAHARALNAASSPLYLQLAEVDLASGMRDAAAEILIEGAFVMSDAGLRERLVDLYKTLGPDSCALTAGRSGPAINPRCPMVHTHLCSAEAPTVATLKNIGQPEMAEKRKRMFAEEFGCRQ